LHSILCSYAGVLGFSILYTYILKNKLFHTKFYNKLTNEHVETSNYVIIKYVISKNYIFFASNVLLLTIGITLFIFVVYHINLVKLNLTSNEKLKRDKMIKFMILIKDTMKNLYLSGEFRDAIKPQNNDFTEEYLKRYKSININKIEENKFEEIVFKSNNNLKIIFRSYI